MNVIRQIAATLALADGSQVGVHLTEAARTALAERSFFDGVERVTGTGQPVEPDRAQGWVDTAMSDYDTRRGSLAWNAMEDRP